MFGGHAFLVNGNLAVSAASKGGLLLRVDLAQTESLVEAAGVSRFVRHGREMNGWLHVQPEAVRTRDQLDTWVRRGTTYARSLPAKK